MSFVDDTRALLQALKAEGSAGAAWGPRVHLRAASEVVEISGTPRKTVFPYVLLRGPTLAEQRALRSDAAREVLATNDLSATATVRPWPRWYTLTFELRLVSRVGYTASAVSAQEELLSMQQRFEQWARAHGRIGSARLVVDTPPGTAPAAPVNAADIVEAVGRVSLRDVPVAGGEPVVVDTVREFVVGTVPRVG